MLLAAIRAPSPCPSATCQEGCRAVPPNHRARREAFFLLLAGLEWSREAFFLLLAGLEWSYAFRHVFSGCPGSLANRRAWRRCSGLFWRSLCWRGSRGALPNPLLLADTSGDKRARSVLNVLLADTSVDKRAGSVLNGRQSGSVGGPGRRADARAIASARSVLSEVRTAIALRCQQAVVLVSPDRWSHGR